MKKTATTNFTATTKGKTACGVNQNASVVAADGHEKQRAFTADEQRCLDEVKELITTFG